MTDRRSPSSGLRLSPLLAVFLACAAAAHPQSEMRSYGYSEGHSLGANCAAFLSDGKRIVTGSNDATVKLWDLSSGLVQKTFAGSGAPIHDLALAGGEAFVLAYSGKDRMILWSIDSGALAGDYAGRERIFDVSADGKLALSMRKSGGWDLELWDIRSGRTVQRFRGHSEAITKAFFMKDGKRILSSSMDATMRIWDRQGGTQRAIFHFPTAVGAIGLSPDEEEILAGTNAPELITYSLRHDEGATADSYRASSSRDGLHSWDMRDIWYIDASTVLSIDLKAGSGDNILLWDCNSGDVLRSWGNGRAWAAVSPDRRLMTTNEHESEGCPIIDLRSGRVIQILAADWEP